MIIVNAKGFILTIIQKHMKNGDGGLRYKIFIALSVNWLCFLNCFTTNPKFKEIGISDEDGISNDRLIIVSH